MSWRGQADMRKQLVARMVVLVLTARFAAAQVLPTASVLAQSGKRAAETKHRR
jgi:hypothetical protein